MKKDQTLWTREELILVFNLYWKLPFGKMDKGTPAVKEMALLIDRSSNAVAIRLTNFASIDPFHQARGVKGMEGGKKQCQPIWDEFVNNKENLLFESERILAEREHITLEEKYPDILAGIENLKGETKIREVKTRVNQNVFRQIVVVNYASKCAITGIDIPDMLVASHIIPWSKNEVERLNPENGICLSSLYDKAYDKGYISINEKLEILISSVLKKKHKEDYYARYFAHLDGNKIIKPKKYQPKKDFLQYHLDIIFKG